jgi:HlyD family secretion protein
LARVEAPSSLERFEAESAAIKEWPEPRGANLAAPGLAAMLLVLALVLFVGRADIVVASTAARIVTSEAPIEFQSLDPSIVKSLNVEEGQQVQAGQVLATLDPTIAAAEVTQLKAQIDSLTTQIARDQAELDGRPLKFEHAGDPDFGRYQTIQLELFTQQMANYNAQLSSYDQQIAVTEATIQKYKADEDQYQAEAKLNKQIEDMRAVLQQHGSGSLLDLLASTDAKLGTMRQTDFDHNMVIENQHALASLKDTRESFIQQFRATTSQDLVTARNSLDTAAAQLQSAMKHRELVRLTAPEPSIVLSVAKVSVGSVLAPGASVMTLTPIRVPLEVEAFISTRDVGFLRPGQSALLKIDAFNYSEHGTVQAKVRWISEDSFTTDNNGAATPPYYKARLAITSIDLINVPESFRLIPGMTLQADINVGTRSPGAYIFGGLAQFVRDAMREP